MTMIRLGFDVGTEQGPGIFLSRLKAELEKHGQFSPSEPDVWIQLSFEALPEWVQARRAQGLTKILVRMDGAYCSRWTAIHKPFAIPIPGIDHWYSQKVNFKKNRRIRENLLQADDIVFQSEFSKAITHQFVTSTPPGTIIFNGISLEDFSPEGDRFALPHPEKTQLLMSHSFQPYHRLHDGFKILHQLKQASGKLFHLSILGHDDGESFAYARQVAHVLGLVEGTDYKFLGKLPFHQLAPVYRAADVMLNLSYWDTCPNVVIEAMACGLPIVGVNHGGVAELIGEFGVLVDEAIQLTYLPHLDFKRMPQAPIERYVQGVFQVLDNRAAYSLNTLKRAQQQFDITHVAQRYYNVALKLSDAKPLPV